MTLFRQNAGDIVISLYDNEGFDVGEILVASNQAKAQIFSPISEESNFIPG